MSMPRTSMFGVGVKAHRVGLHDTAVFQEQQALFAGWHGADEGFGLIERGAQTPRDPPGIDRCRQRKIGVIVLPIAGIAADFPRAGLRAKNRGLWQRRPR